MTKPQRATTPPIALIDAFRLAEATSEQVGAAVDGDGIDHRMVRVLVAWMHAEQSWLEPARPRPDGDRPTPASWRWLVEGWEMDYEAIAAAADVSVSVARNKMAVLVGCRLVYPDGKPSKAARLLVQGAIRRAVRAGRERKQAGGQAPTDESAKASKKSGGPPKSGAAN